MTIYKYFFAIKYKAVPATDESVEETAFPVFDEPAKAAPLTEENAAPEEKAPVAEVSDVEASSDQTSAPDAREADHSSADEESQGPAKRKRRRRKGKGNGPQNEETSDEEGESAPDGEDSAESPRNSQSRQNQNQNQNQRQRPKADPVLLAKFAWKIFLAEVSEEGVALVGDNDARDLSRRCFRLAEIFLDEKARHC